MAILLCRLFKHDSVHFTLNPEADCIMRKPMLVLDTQGNRNEQMHVFERQ
jgi:hypothetical protein